MRSKGMIYCTIYRSGASVFRSLFTSMKREGEGRGRERRRGEGGGG